MSRPDQTTTGRGTGECANDHDEALAVDGVVLPGDVGVFVRDDTLGQDATPPAGAGWRHQRAPAAVTLYPTAPGGGAHHYLAEIGRWDTGNKRYSFEALLTNGPLEKLRPVVESALRHATGRPNPVAELVDFADQRRP